MTNGELIGILQRFPVEGTVKVRRVDASRVNALLDIDFAEMGIDPTPARLQAQNVGWADLVKERIQVVLVFGSTPAAIATEPIKEKP